MLFAFASLRLFPSERRTHTRCLRGRPRSSAAAAERRGGVQGGTERRELRRVCAELLRTLPRGSAHGTRRSVGPN